MEQRAIVITYIGDEVTEYILSSMVQHLVTNGLTTVPKIHASVLDNNDILKLIINKNQNVINEDTEDPKNKWYPLEQAVIYLSTFYKDHLAENTLEFSVRASRDTLVENMTPEYKNSVKILCKYIPFTRTAASIMNKYKFSLSFAKILVAIYKLKTR